MSLYHFTCAHAAQKIVDCGLVRPAIDFHDGPLPTWSGLLCWFTDLDFAPPEAVGLTSTMLLCDRTAHRFLVTDDSNVHRWIDSSWRRHWWAGLLESAPGALPRHWFIADVPVPVQIDPPPSAGRGRRGSR
jgi:hypothetical protein